MTRALGYVLVVLALISVAYATRSNICLANTGTGTPYKPLQLYPSDCPNNASNCMAAVYKYSAKDFKSLGPSTILPVAKNRESLAYLTQDENDNLDLVIITATTYNDNKIKVNVKLDGVAPGPSLLVQDDIQPTDDIMNWDSVNNVGNFTWDLDAYFTDGVVIGHLQFVDNYCVRMNFLPNYNGAIASISFLSGTVASPTRVFTQKLVNAQYYEFCQYPKTTITKTDASCTALGSASATSPSGTATYAWTKADGTTVATTSSVSGLAPGAYSVTVTVNGCTATRPVTIGNTGVPISATSTLTNPTKTTAGTITLKVSGGNPPYSITWMNPSGTVVARNVTSLSVTTAGTYTVTIADNCGAPQTLNIDVSAPGSCAPGTMVDGDNCDPCPAGTYSTTNDAAACTVCPPGTASTVSGATSCTSCAANTYSAGAIGPCNNCPQSTFSDARSGVCTPCPVGTDRASGATSCAPCPAGSFRCDAKQLCSSCPAGTFSAAGAQACSSCDPGTLSASGAASCSVCAANQYAPSGASACTSCPSGTNAPAGSSVLLACMNVTGI